MWEFFVFSSLTILIRRRAMRCCDEEQNDIDLFAPISPEIDEFLEKIKKELKEQKKPK